MNGTESRLRGALDDAARTVRPDDLAPLVASRARARFRIRVRRPVLIAVTAVGLVAAAAGVVQVWPMPSNLAAAWSATPQPADSRIAAQLVEGCLSMIDDMVEADRSTKQRVIVDQRGNSAVVNIQTGSHAANCTFVGLDRTDPRVLKYAGAGAGWPNGAPVQPVGDSVLTLESLSTHAVKGDALSEISGQIGPGVDRVVVTLEDGSEVEARVHDGWYLAWWPEETKWSFPWDDDVRYDRRMPTLVRAYDATGRLLKEHVPAGVPGR